jgi:hypothetical protein
MKRSVLIAALAAGLAACATAPAAPELNADGSPVEKECRKINLPGSNIIKRDCKTAQEWAKHDSEEEARNAGLLGIYRETASPNSMIR